MICPKILLTKRAAKLRIAALHRHLAEGWKSRQYFRSTDQGRATSLFRVLDSFDAEEIELRGSSFRAKKCSSARRVTPIRQPLLPVLVNVAPLKHAHDLIPHIFGFRKTQRYSYEACVLAVALVY